MNSGHATLLKVLAIKTGTGEKNSIIGGGFKTGIAGYLQGRERVQGSGNTAPLLDQIAAYRRHDISGGAIQPEP
jgi:hypothetical protein